MRVSGKSSTVLLHELKLGSVDRSVDSVVLLEEGPNGSAQSSATPQEGQVCTRSECERMGVSAADCDCYAYTEECSVVGKH